MSFKISFFSNYLNHHQTPFCNEMHNLLGDEYKFVATEKISQARIDLGYKDVCKEYSYVIDTCNSSENKKKCMQLALSSDVLIIGSAPEYFVKQRIDQNKLTFRYSERIFKKGMWRILSPRAIIGNYLMHTQYRNRQNVHMLCASAYTPIDMQLLHAYPGRMWKWGYFPQVNYYDMDELFSKKSTDKPRLLWVGRFLDWKQPQKAIILAKRLRDSGYHFQLDFIGTGEMENDLKNLTERYALLDKIRFLGSMPAETVREQMEKANIFIFTSTKQEGWGAVLNESMNSGCAVVANRVIGSAPYLIKEGENGFTYNNDEKLYQQVKYLLDYPQIARQMGENACKTMINEWSPKIAAERILQLSQAILEESGASDLFMDGPLSRAGTK